MSEDMKTLKDILQEDLMLRTPLVKYTLKMFSDTLTVLQTIKNTSQVEESIQIAQEYLEKNRQSPITIFSVIFLNIYSGNSAESYIDKLFSIFSQVKKQSIVVYVAREVLKLTDSHHCLEVLAHFYQSEGQHEELIDIWVRMLSKEPRDYELPEKIAHLKRKMGDLAEAVRYFKMSFFRALEQRDLNKVLEIWRLLLKFNIDDVSFFIDFGKKISSLLNKDKGAQFYKELFHQYFKQYQSYTDVCLDLIKMYFDLEPEDIDEKENLILLYKEKYKNHTQLEDLLNLSGLLKTKKNIPAQIDIFEKHIIYDKGTFVYHKTFGYGVILDIQKPMRISLETINMTKLIIDFTKKRKHTMTLRIALGSLEICYMYNINCLKAFNAGKLQDLLKMDPIEVAKAVLKTFNKPVSNTEIKKMFIPDIVSADEWSAFWKPVKKLLQSDPAFEYKNKLYSFTPPGGSYKDELLTQFNRTYEIDLKIKILDVYMLNFRQIDEYAKEMADYFFNNVENEKHLMKSLLALKSLSRGHKLHKPFDFESLFINFVRDCDIGHEFDILSTAVMRNILIDEIARTMNESAFTMLEIIYFTQTIQGKNHLLEVLLNNNKIELIQQIWKKIRSDLSHYTTHYIYMVKQFFFDHDNAFELIRGKVYKDLLNILKMLHKDIELETELGQKKKLQNILMDLVFGEDELLFQYLKTSDAEAFRKDIFDQLNSMLFLENYLKVEIKELMTKLG
jgi:transcription elongation factor GreA-like protein